MRAAILAIVALIMLGCVSSPPIDTVNKKMAAFEIGYQETIKFALVLRSEGRLSDDLAIDITKMFDRIDVARSAVYAAINAGDINLANGHLVAAQKLLTAINSILKEIEHGERDISYRDVRLFA